MRLKKLLKFIKGRWFPSLVLLVALAFVLLEGFLLGFRITYAPALENSWEAISAVASWSGVAASFAAVWYAVRVADKQNRIALFEKRYELFEIILNSQILSNALKNAKNNLDVRMTFFVTFCYNSIDNNQIPDDTVISAKHIVIIQKLKQIPFLFENVGDLDGVPELISTLSDLVTSYRDNESDFQEKIQKFSDYINSEKYKKLMNAMQKELSLK